MITRASAFVSLAAALLVAGCAAPQTAEPGPAGYPNLLVGPDTAAELGYSIQWQTPLALPDRTAIAHAQLIAGRLVMMDTDNVAYVVNAANGKLMWSSRIGKQLDRFVAPRLDDKRLVMCSETRAYFYSLDHGDDLGFLDLYYGTNTAPAIVGGLMLHGNGSGMVWAQDMEIGIRRWNHKLSGGVLASPVIAVNAVLFADTAGQVTMFNPASGTVLWEQKTFDRISADPVATELLVYVASEDHSVYAFERTTGNIRWRHFGRDPFFRDPALASTALLVNEDRRGTVALDPFSGAEQWVNPLLNADFIQQRTDTIWLFADAALHQLSAKTGETWQTTKLPRVDRVIGDDPKGGNLFLIDHDSGRILKLAPR